MPTMSKRRVLEIGDSLGITIPKDIINSYLLKKGDNITVIADALDVDGFIVVDIKGRGVQELWKLLKE